ncbi:hypothetical protein ACFE04_026704 [Oxalis oulophora]
MGCVVSKRGGSGGEGDDVVLICKERKKLMKQSVERRLAFGEAHCNYNQSLYAMAAALRLFVTRQTSPSPLFITFPTTNCSNESVVSSSRTSSSSSVSMFLQQRPSQPTTQAINDVSGDNKVCSFNAKVCSFNGDDDDDDDDDDDEPVVVCEHFYDEGFEQNQTVSPQYNNSMSNSTHFGWDFFEPFVRNEEVGPINDEDFKVVREQEGIPELEEEEVEEVVVVNNGVNGDLDVKPDEGEVAKSVSHEEKTGFDDKEETGLDNKSELLAALKSIEDQFVRAYESGLDVSTMLEFNRVELQPNFEENVRENSNKLIPTITWSRSTSARSSSCKSILSTSSSKSSSTWLESRCGDLFDDCGGMEAGSHSSTLGRLYAWEKKLYEEVKIGDQTRKCYERKCSQLRDRDSRGDGLYAADKTRAEVKDLHTRILVAIRSAESISDKIEKLRDDELHPQLIELLHGLMRNWKIMLESHEFQIRIISEVTSFNCSTYGQFCNDSHRFATLQLEAELHNWHACFAKYVTTQKAYISALNGWLSKFIAPEVELYSKKSSIPPCGNSAPPLLVLCQTWLTSMDTLPDKVVMSSMKSFGKDIRALWLQQGIEQQQKKKVDRLVKEIEKEDRKIFSSGISEYESEASIRNRIEILAEKKDQLGVEKEKHVSSMKETRRITVDGLQTGFSSIFESLAEFSKASVKMYGDLVTYSEDAKPKEEENDIYSSYLDELSYHLTS